MQYSKNRKKQKIGIIFLFSLFIILNYSCNTKKEKTVTVNAILPAINTGIYLEEGMVISFKATGTWSWGESCDADGTEGRPYPDELPVLLNLKDCYFGTLIGKVNDNYFRIGKNSTYEIPSNLTGILYLQMNERVGDIWYSDNSGSISVKITY